MPIGALNLSGLSSAQLAVLDRMRKAIAREAKRDRYWGRRDFETPWLPPLNWVTGGAGTRANTTAYVIGMVVQNAALTHQFLCTTGGTSAAAEPAAMTNPGNAGATPWGCGPITDGTVTWVWFGAVRTTVAKVDAPVASIGAVPALLTQSTNITGAVQSRVFFSGGLGPIQAGGFGFAAQTIPSGGGSNIGYDDGTNSYQMTFGAASSFFIDAPFFAIGGFGPITWPANAAVSIEIDDLRVSDSPPIVAAAITPGVLTLDFRISGGRRERKVTLRQNNTVGAYQLFTTPADSLRFADNPLRFRLYCVGNSILAGANGYPFWGGNGLGEHIAAVLGCDDVWVDGTGGTGFVAPGTGYAFTHPNKLGWAQRVQPDVIVVVSNSDVGVAPVTAAVQQWIGSMRARLPNALFFITGNFPGSTGPSAAVLATEGAVAAGVLASGDAGTCFIPIGTDAAGAALSGTGNIGAATGVGNADVLVQPDGTHPGVWGNQWLSRRIAYFIERSILA